MGNYISDGAQAYNFRSNWYGGILAVYDRNFFINLLMIDLHYMTPSGLIGKYN